VAAASAKFEPERSGLCLPMLDEITEPCGLDDAQTNPDDRPIVHPRVWPESDCLWRKLSAAGHHPDEISAAEYLDENAHQEKGGALLQKSAEPNSNRL